MGRFDLLTQSEQKAPRVASEKVIRAEEARKPASPQAVKPASPQTGLSKTEQVEKYTTRLEPSLVKKIKLYALENDMNDYDVIRSALKKLLTEEK